MLAVFVGIISYSKTAEFNNLNNYGNISAVVSKTGAGAVIGQVPAKIKIDNSRNFGEINKTLAEKNI